jgi:hypothetical protein
MDVFLLLKVTLEFQSPPKTLFFQTFTCESWDSVMCVGIENGCGALRIIRSINLSNLKMQFEMRFKNIGV